MTTTVAIPTSGKPFNNQATSCVGSGRLRLALQQEYLDHLQIVQKAIQFRYIRGHGLFCDVKSALLKEHYAQFMKQGYLQE